MSWGNVTSAGTMPPKIAVDAFVSTAPPWILWMKTEKSPEFPEVSWSL